MIIIGSDNNDDDDDGQPAPKSMSVQSVQLIILQLHISEKPTIKILNHQ